VAQQHGFVAASGYGQLEAGILARVGYWNEILSMKCYEEASWGHWVNSMADDILMQNQVVKFEIVDEPTPMRPYEKNQELVDDEPSAYETCAQLCFAEYSQDKINDLDIFRNPERLDKFMSERQEKRVALYGETLNYRVLARFIAECDPINQGTNAGAITHGHNLGTSAVPKDLTNPATITKFFAALQSVAIETKCFNKGAGWHMVIPNQLLLALYDTPLANRFDLGACSELVCNLMNNGGIVNGMNGPYGFRWWVNLEMSRPNAVGAVPVICFHESAQLFASELIVNRVYEREQFDRVYQLLAVSGGSVLYPHKVIVAWIKV
jgi:hypothetical protein